MTVPGQRFEGEIGRHVGALPWRPEQCRRRGEQQKQFDRIIPRQPIERDCAVELRPQHRRAGVPG